MTRAIQIKTANISMKLISAIEFNGKLQIVILIWVRFEKSFGILRVNHFSKVYSTLGRKIKPQFK